MPGEEPADHGADIREDADDPDAGEVEMGRTDIAAADVDRRRRHKGDRGDAKHGLVEVGRNSLVFSHTAPNTTGIGGVPAVTRLSRHVEAGEIPVTRQARTGIGVEWAWSCPCVARNPGQWRRWTQRLYLKFFEIDQLGSMSGTTLRWIWATAMTTECSTPFSNSGLNRTTMTWCWGLLANR